LGSSTAAVPRITRSMPALSNCSMVSSWRMPPPSWVGISTALAISVIMSRLWSSPLAAPSRSTICNLGAPSDCHCKATSTGSSENIVSAA
jgi:hypothetical protein